MGEILFRGKVFGENYWIQGYLVRDWDLCYIYWSGTKTQVYPDTVGMYTGRNDKNGKKIFDGDKVTPHEGHYVVSFDNYSMSWVMNHISGDQTVSIGYNLSLEIVGNIHDTETTSK